MLAAKKQPLISARADFLVICIYYSAIKRTTLVGNGNCQKNTSFLCYISGYKFCSSTSELLQTQPWTQFLCSCKKHISNYYSSKHCLISWVPFAESPVPHLGLNPFPAHFFSATPLWNLSKVLSAPFTLSWTKRGGGNQFSLYQRVLHVPQETEFLRSPLEKQQEFWLQAANLYSLKQSSPVQAI